MSVTVALIATVLFTLPACDGAGQPATPAPVHTPTPSPFPPLTPAPGAICALDVSVTWHGPLEPPRESYAITIALRDADVDHADWVLGDAAGVVEQGRLFRGGSTRVERAVDWDSRPLGGSNELFYVHARGDDGSTFARVVAVEFRNPPTAASPTPTLSCGYASFALETEPDLVVEHPADSVIVGIANRGILDCGRLDWRIVQPPLQAGVLSCSPAEGALAGAGGVGESTTEEIRCAVDWSDIEPGQRRDYVLVLFSYPAVNGVDSAHLVRVRAVR
jgi:hypothetical protein